MLVSCYQRAVSLTESLLIVFPFVVYKQPNGIDFFNESINIYYRVFFF